MRRFEGIVNYRYARDFMTGEKSTTCIYAERDGDLLVIPMDPDNSDYKDFLVWLAKGNTPLPMFPISTKS